jgi:Tol biopolymer transport system component
MVTANIPSYFHGWSRDGRWLAFVGERGGNFDIYRVSSTGGKEERLTSSPGFDDGPDYSPDGKWIYINTDRSGGWDIWRFPAEGAGPGDSKAERVTGDAGEDWFPHPSPDGKRLLFLTFPAGTKGHDFKTAVQLRMIPLPSSDAPAQLPKNGDDDAIPVLTQFFGGQGSINVNSWSPDSKKFAFVSYELLP